MDGSWATSGPLFIPRGESPWRATAVTDSSAPKPTLRLVSTTSRIPASALEAAGASGGGASGGGASGGGAAAAPSNAAVCCAAAGGASGVPPRLTEAKSSSRNILSSSSEVLTFFLLSLSLKAPRWRLENEYYYTVVRRFLAAKVVY